MKYWYQKPHPSIEDYVHTVLILETSSQSATQKLPLFTNGMPALFCKIEKDATENEAIIQLALFGTSTSPDCWEINNNTTIVCYFLCLGSCPHEPKSCKTKSSCKLARAHNSKIKKMPLMDKNIFAVKRKNYIEFRRNIFLDSNYPPRFVSPRTEIVQNKKQL